jgi:hypothetical protein
MTSITTFSVTASSIQASGAWNDVTAWPADVEAGRLVAVVVTRAARVLAGGVARVAGVVSACGVPARGVPARGVRARVGAGVGGGGGVASRVVVGGGGGGVASRAGGGGVAPGVGDGRGVASRVGFGARPGLDAGPVNDIAGPRHRRAH